MDVTCPVRVATDDQKKRLEELRASVANEERSRDELRAFYLRAREGFLRRTAELFASIESLARAAGLATHHQMPTSYVTDGQTHENFQMSGALVVGPPGGKQIVVVPESSFQQLMMPRGFAGLKVHLRGSPSNASRDIIYDDTADKLVFVERAKVRDVDPLEILEWLK